MEEMTWGEFAPQYLELFEGGQFKQAYELVTPQEHLFSTRSLYYRWRILAAANFDPELALSVMREAVDSGYWFNARILRADEAMQPVRNLPEFEQLMEISEQRQAEAQAQTLPRLLTAAPEVQQETYSLLIALHGAAHSSSNTIDHWKPITGNGWLVAVPQSSQLLEPEQYTWEDAALAEREIRDHYQSMLDQYSVDTSRVVVGGFSMGGGLALHIALKGTIPARGFVLAAPYWPDVDALDALLKQRPDHGLRGYIVVGEHDHGFETVRKIEGVLQKYVVPYEMEIVPLLDHRYPVDFDLYLARALAFVTQAESPAGGTASVIG